MEWTPPFLVLSVHSGLLSAPITFPSPAIYASLCGICPQAYVLRQIRCCSPLPTGCKPQALSCGPTAILSSFRSVPSPWPSGASLLQIQCTSHPSRCETRLKPRHHECACAHVHSIVGIGDSNVNISLGRVGRIPKSSRAGHSASRCSNWNEFLRS